MHGAWVYILKCADGMYYVGSHRGDDPSTRAAEHNSGADPKAFTYKDARSFWSGANISIRSSTQ